MSTEPVQQRQMWGVGYVDDGGAPVLIEWFYRKQDAEWDLARRHAGADYLRSVGKPAVGEHTRLLTVTLDVVR